MPANKYINLVFQGGGVRGIAYAGALASKPEHVRINAVAGTSAGSIVAGLLAIGKSPAQIKGILEDPKLRSLVADDQLQRTERIKKAWNDLKAVWFVDKKGKPKISYWGALRFARSHRDVFSEIKDVWDSKGFHSSKPLRKFLDQIFEERTFENLAVEDLKIVAADVSRQEYEIYSKNKNLTIPIAQAVHASVSIPLFFEPFVVGPEHFVDGGLLSNFPSFLFAQGFYPTIGFRLIDVAPPKDINSTRSFLQALLLTMTNAHDKQRGHPPYFHPYDIETPSNIPSTKFALTEQDVKDLFDEGEKTGGRVKWDEHASARKTVSYYDPKPDETLSFSLQQAHTLFNEYSTRHRVEHLLQESTFSVYIEPDWSTRYVNRSRMTISGNKQLVLTRSVWYGEPIGGKPLSLVDLNVVAKEVLSGGEKDLIRIPAYNSERERGYLLFYSPPVSSESPRDFRHEFEVNQEFAKTVEKGQEDFVAYSVQRLGDNHRLKLKFEILVHVDLPNLQFDSDVGRDLEEDKTLVSDPKTKGSYKSYFVNIPETPIIGTVMFKIRVSRV